MKKESSPFLKSSVGGKPPTRKEMKKGGLGGRGVLALVGTPKQVRTEVANIAPQSPVVQSAPAPQPPADNGIIEVVAVDIERSPWQARAEFEEAALKELADSIRANGIVQPPVVRRRADGKYELIAGERRTRAAIMAGLKKIPVILADADDRKAAEMGVVENIQRRDLNVIEEAEGYRLLKEQFGITQEDVAERVGKSRPAIANSLRLLELPDEVKQLLSRGILSAGHAKVLLSVEGERDRTLLARECAERSLTVRELEKRVARLKKPVVAANKGTPDLPESYVRSLVETLHRHLGCAVRLTSGVTHANGKHTKGLLEIDFFNNDDLDRILNMMGVQVD
ncbi:MAG: ParB/RepB/Spo0J family partition protein [Kiritimatiellae bacterium]|nr:ParB/RepB/Spo0J family partition protein [Kiritimatiellia bacterium]